MPIRVCFVCLGNICRSPTAEGVFRDLVDRADLATAIEIDSAGTAAYHAGEPPDRRSTATARARGVTLGGRARQFRADDFARFDYVVAMDRDNHEALLRLAERSPEPTASQRLSMLRDHDPASPAGASVPDPYYGGARGFEDVFDICLAGCRGLLTAIRERHEL